MTINYIENLPVRRIAESKTFFPRYTSYEMQSRGISIDQKLPKAFSYRKIKDKEI